MYTPAQGGYFVTNNMQEQQFVPAAGVPNDAGRQRRNNYANLPGQFNQYMPSNGQGFQSRRPNPVIAGAHPQQFAQGAQQGGRIPQRMPQHGSFPLAGVVPQARPVTGGVNPGASGMQQQFNQGQQRFHNEGILVQGQEPLSLNTLTRAAPQEQKQLLGERIYSLVGQMYPGNSADVAKITGMMLEIDNSELIMMLQDNELFRSKVREAASVLQTAGKSS